MSDFQLIQAATIASAYDGEFHRAAEGLYCAFDGTQEIPLNGD